MKWMAERKKVVKEKQCSEGTMQRMKRIAGQSMKCLRCKKKRARLIATHGRFLLAISEIWESERGEGILIGFRGVSGKLSWSHIWKRGVS